MIKSLTHLEHIMQTEIPSYNLHTRRPLWFDDRSVTNSLECFDLWTEIFECFCVETKRHFLSKFYHLLEPSHSAIGRTCRYQQFCCYRRKFNELIIITNKSLSTIQFTKSWATLLSNMFFLTTDKRPDTPYGLTKWQKSTVT